MFPMQGNQPDDKLYVDDVFSAYTYTGNGSTQTITNGIDLAGKGGLVWIKSRTSGTSPNILCDSGVGLPYALQSQSNNAKIDLSPKGVTSFNSNGFGVSDNASEYYYVNTSSQNYASWTFRKAPKFFDVVTYTGNGVAGRQIPHALGIAPGMIIVKQTNSSRDWAVYHRSTGATHYSVLNSTDIAQDNNLFWNDTAPTATEFTLGSVVNTNGNGGLYVAYLFAHDTSADGIIQCGTFTTDGSGNATVNLGWEPQFIISRNTNFGSGWMMADSSRKFIVSPPAGPNANARLQADSSGVEAGEVLLYPTATGFAGAESFTSSSYIYLAIRRPNKPPTVGTQVYSSQSIAGNSTARCFTGIGFAPDTVISNVTTPGATAYPRAWRDKLRGTNAFLKTYTADGTTSATDALLSYDMDGISVGPDSQTFSINRTTGFVYSHYFFKRAPGVSDQICTTGTGANKTEAHNLTVAPELWLHKGCTNTTEWVWGSSLLANTQKIVMPSPNGVVTDATAWNSTYPTASVISFGTAAAVNTTSNTYSTYMWATLAGVSKVFTYTGDGGSGKVIDCGFTTGARFVLIIRTTASTTQDIFVWDTVRGIVAGNDPHLSLNTTAAEVTTDDSIDPDTSGFAVNQVAATNINVNGAVYIGLAYS